MVVDATEEEEESVLAHLCAGKDVDNGGQREKGLELGECTRTRTNTSRLGGKIGVPMGPA